MSTARSCDCNFEQVARVNMKGRQHCSFSCCSRQFSHRDPRQCSVRQNTRNLDRSASSQFPSVDLRSAEPKFWDIVSQRTYANPVVEGSTCNVPVTGVRSCYCVAALLLPLHYWPLRRMLSPHLRWHVVQQIYKISSEVAPMKMMWILCYSSMLLGQNTKYCEG